MIRIEGKLPVTDVQDWPHWLVVVSIVVGAIAVWTLNNIYFAWLRRNWPWLLRPRALLVILAISAAAIAFGLWINPPSEVRKAFENQNRALLNSH